jgi:hypothetical protein
MATQSGQLLCWLSSRHTTGVYFFGAIHAALAKAQHLFGNIFQGNVPEDLSAWRRGFGGRRVDPKRSLIIGAIFVGTLLTIVFVLVANDKS